MATLTAEKTNGSPMTYRNPFHSDFLFGEDFFAPLSTMRRAMLTPFAAPWVLPEFPAFTIPAVNLYEKDGGYVVELAVPGYKKDDLTIEVSGNNLTVNGKFESEKKDAKKYHWHELRTGSFSRTVTLPLEIDPEQVTATIENGVLKIALQPEKSIQRKTIPIKGLTSAAATANGRGSKG
jgi:HSP20 family molecular chaperone IbpA